MLVTLEHRVSGRAHPDKQSAHGRTLLKMAIWALLVNQTACGHENGRCDAGEHRQAVYGGSAQPEQVQLSAGERSAIVSVRERMSGDVLCTATVIAPSWVITAAHCIETSALEVVAERGTWDRPMDEAVVKTDFDLALLRLRTPAPASVTPLIVSRPTPNTLERVELAGFGETETGSSGELLFAQAEVIRIDDGTITVRDLGDGGPCFGDSGGPLMIAGPHGTELLGSLSVGSASCNGLEVYLRLDRVTAWIDGAIGQSWGNHADCN